MRRFPPRGSYGGRLDDDDDKYRQRKGTVSRLFWRTFGYGPARR